MDIKVRSQFQERLVCLFLRLNGYLQTGYIPHSNEWGNSGTDIDRIGIRFPHHSQDEREIKNFKNLDIPKNSIDIIIAEVKNNSLQFNDPITKVEKRAAENWKQILNWIGLFEKDEVKLLIPIMIDIANKNGQIEDCTFSQYTHENKYGKITIRPILFSFETKKTETSTKKWVNGEEILLFMWQCFCPDIRRDYCSTQYPFTLWGNEFSDIVEYLKDRHKKGIGIPNLNEIYNDLT
ncbi:hypothetical protein [Flavobacterium daejeonense]|uniref:hypothetical protein n=1 Tax=Flavobacterium daejeonense TaxID=350893 RepID=UPI00047B93DE|nr:hypothetical protein [Flavobacterium daejeonense]